MPRNASGTATFDASIADATLEPTGPAPTSAPRQRIPFGTLQQKLELHERPGFKAHWFNDRPGRIERAKAAGYSHITEHDGKPKQIVVGQDGGQALIAYAMEIPEEFFKEDFIRSQQKVNAIDATVRAGTLETKPGDGRYTPKDGIKFSEGR